VRIENSTSTERNAGTIPQRRVTADPSAGPAPDGAADARPRVAPRPAAAPATPFFRIPSTGDPTPPAGRIVAMCGWAAALGLVGVFLAIRALVALVGSVPGWYEPVVTADGVVGIALTVAAFLAVHREKLPWYLLSAATATLGVNLIAVLTGP